MQISTSIGRYTVVLIVLWLISLPGCKSSKKLFIGDIPTKSNKELKQALRSQVKSYEWITLKARLNYKDERESVRGTVHVKAKKDSIIWMRITKFGFEGARIRITPHYMEIINRIDKTYQKKSFQNIKHEFGIAFSFNDIEDMLIGNPLFPNSRYESSQDSTGYILKRNMDDVELQYHLSPANLLIDQLQLTQYRQGQLIADYMDYEVINDSTWIFPKKRLYHSTEANGEQKRIELKLSSAQINTPATIQFNIPDHYEYIP